MQEPFVVFGRINVQNSMPKLLRVRINCGEYGSVNVLLIIGARLTIENGTQPVSIDFPEDEEHPSL